MVNNLSYTTCNILSYLSVGEAQNGVTAFSQVSIFALVSLLSLWLAMPVFTIAFNYEVSNFKVTKKLFANRKLELVFNASPLKSFHHFLFNAGRLFKVLRGYCSEMSKLFKFVSICSVPVKKSFTRSLSTVFISIRPIKFAPLGSVSKRYASLFEAFTNSPGAAIEQVSNILKTLLLLYIQLLKLIAIRKVFSATCEGAAFPRTVWARSFSKGLYCHFTAEFTGNRNAVLGWHGYHLSTINLSSNYTMHRGRCQIDKMHRGRWMTTDQAMKATEEKATNRAEALLTDLLNRLGN